MSPWQRVTTGPGILVIGGLLFWAFAWYLDFATHVEKFGIGTGPHAHGGDGLLRINFPLTGAPCVAFGLMQIMGTDVLLKRGGLLVWTASFLLMLDGLAHAFAFTDHLGVLSSAAFFAFLAPAEIAVGLALPFIDRKFDLYVAAGMVGLLVLYIVSRTAALPALGWPETVEALDIFSKLVEVLVVVSLVWYRRASAPLNSSAPGERPGDAPAAADP